MKRTQRLVGLLTAIAILGTVSLTAYAHYQDTRKLPSFSVTINGVDVLEGIEISQAPAKTTYAPGESFDPTGMVVTARLTDGSRRTVTDYRFPDGTKLTEGQTSIRLEYSLNGHTATASVEISVPYTRYEIRYDLAGGEGSNPESYTAADSFTLNAPTRTGFRFLGWTGSCGTEPQLTVEIPAGTRGDLSYTANWIPEETTETEPEMTAPTETTTPTETTVPSEPTEGGNKP